MKTFNLKCDRCGNQETIEREDQSKLLLCMVGIALHDSRNYYHYGSTAVVADLKNKQEWCRKCCIEVGLITKPDWDKTEATPPPAPLPLETQLMELLRAIIAENVPQS